MLPGMDPKKMQAMMKQLGIKQEEIEAERVIIEKADGNNIIIESPSIVKVKMQGQESWQITGDAREESSGIKEEDIKLVMEKTGSSKEEAFKLLEESEGDIAEAILKASS